MKNLNISIILAVLMSMAGGKVFAGDRVRINNIYYELASDTASVTYYSTETGKNAVAYYGDIVIPETVTYKDKVYRVTWVGSSAFNYCPGITSISFPKSLRGFGGSAFSSCKSLKSITLPDSLKWIGGAAFVGCTAISEITFPEDLKCIGYNAFADSKFVKLIIPKSVTYIGYNAFKNSYFDYIISKNSSTRFYYDGEYLTFNERVIRHTKLYVPVGEWRKAAFGNWWPFYHIQEMAMETDDLSQTQAYSLVNLETSENVYYDNVNNDISAQSIHQDLNTSNLNNYWQIIYKDGKYYLYNIGAHMYAYITEDGHLVMSIVPVEVEINNADTGVTIGTDTSTRWGFVIADGVDVDKDVTGIEGVKTSSTAIEEYYTLDGKRLKAPQKGVNIIRMSDGTTKKVIIK